MRQRHQSVSVGQQALNEVTENLVPTVSFEPAAHPTNDERRGPQTLKRFLLQESGSKKWLADAQLQWKWCNLVFSRNVSVHAVTNTFLPLIVLLTHLLIPADSTHSNVELSMSFQNLSTTNKTKQKSVICRLYKARGEKKQFFSNLVINRLITECFL